MRHLIANGQSALKIEYSTWGGASGIIYYSNISIGDEVSEIQLNLSRVVHNYVVERGWSGANEHYT
jgi:hypothetical protein